MREIKFRAWDDENKKILYFSSNVRISELFSFNKNPEQYIGLRDRIGR